MAEDRRKPDQGVCGEGAWSEDRDPLGRVCTRANGAVPGWDPFADSLSEGGASRRPNCRSGSCGAGNSFDGAGGDAIFTVDLHLVASMGSWVRNGQGKHSPGTVKLAKGHRRGY